MRIDNLDDLLVTKMQYSVEDLDRGLRETKREKLGLLDQYYEGTLSKLKIRFWGKSPEIIQMEEDLLLLNQMDFMLWIIARANGIALFSTPGLNLFLDDLKKQGIDSTVLNKIKRMRNSDSKEEQEKFIEKLSEILSKF
jgi:hypothetical protein